jgi:hypothetical protein
MRRLRWVTLVWPGLPQLWFAGSWTGLAMAAGFAALLNLAFVCSRLWTELFSPELLALIWLVAGMIWIASAAVSVRWVAALKMSGPSADDEDLFNSARSEYLKGNWFEAELALNRLLTGNLLDVEARLMLATLLRHTGRHEEAAEQLARLSRTDGAERWTLEIARQRTRLAAQMREAAESPVDSEASDDMGDEAGGDGAEQKRLSEAA